MKKTNYGTLLAGSEKMRLNASSNPCFEYEFYEAINIDKLKCSVKEACKTCPYMKLTMKKQGKHYFFKENANEIPVLEEEIPSFDCKEDNGFLVHVIAKDKTMILKVSHGLTDGQGLRWFANAIIAAYYGFEADYSGFGKEDYDADLMAERLEVSDDFVYKDPTVKPIFRLPEAGLSKYFVYNIIKSMVFNAPNRTYQHEITVDRELIKNFCNEMNCSTSIAIMIFVAKAVQKVHSENTRAITFRSPVNTRKILNVPNTFQNASMPQAVAVIMPSDLENITPEVVGKISEHFNEQLCYDTMAYETNCFNPFIPKDNNKSSEVMRTLDQSLFVNNMGSIVPKEAEAYIRNVKVRANGGVPFMIYFMSLRDKILITVAQSFEDESYVEALKSVLSGM